MEWQAEGRILKNNEYTLFLRAAKWKYCFSSVLLHPITQTLSLSLSLCLSLCLCVCLLLSFSFSLSLSLSLFSWQDDSPPITSEKNWEVITHSMVVSATSIFPSHTHTHTHTTYENAPVTKIEGDDLENNDSECCFFSNLVHSGGWKMGRFISLFICLFIFVFPSVVWMMSYMDAILSPRSTSCPLKLQNDFSHLS